MTNEKDANVIHNLFYEFHYADDLGVIKSKLSEYVATVRAEAKDAADSERQAILNAIEHSQRLCTHRAQDNSKTGEYRLMMEHFAEAGRQIAEMITEKRYQDLARPINQTEP